jgi:hypothetical protein
MRVRFGELSADEALALQRARDVAREAWRCLRAGDDARACRLFAELDPRLTLGVERSRDEPCVLAELSALESPAWPLAEMLLAQAPTDLTCRLALGRMALPLERALAEVRASHELKLEGASLRAGFGRGHLLDVTVGVPGGVGSENEQNGAENLVRALLGDRLFETWIGTVHATPAPRGGSLRVLDVNAPRTTLRLHELFDTVAAAARGVLQGLPGEPHAWRARNADERDATDDDDDDERGDWTMLEVEPLADARGVRKEDLVLASTCMPELLRCYLDGSPCASRRFSRLGEVFVFVSYADEAGSLQQRLQRRAELEKLLADAVAGVGAVTGVGLGVKTSYVDLALCNLETGLARLVSKLRDAGAPRDTFIQFFDSELADEWLSIGPDSRLTEG